MWFIYTAAHSSSRSVLVAKMKKKKPKEDKWKINEYANGRLTLKQNAFTHLECRFAQAAANGKRAAIQLTTDRQGKGTRGEEAATTAAAPASTSCTLCLHKWMIIIYLLYREWSARNAHTKWRPSICHTLTHHTRCASFVGWKHFFLWFHFICWTAANKWPMRECIFVCERTTINCESMNVRERARNHIMFNKSQALMPDEYAQNIPRSSEIVLNFMQHVNWMHTKNSNTKCKHLIGARLHLQLENFSLLKIRNTAE